MNFIEFESAQKLRGGYYTPLEVAAFLAQWVLEARPRRILEPACGDGVFVEALARLGPAAVETVVGFEINPHEAKKARARRLPGAAVKITTRDFLGWFLAQSMPAPEFDAVLGNPPFIRYQYLDGRTQARAEEIFHNYGLAFTKHTNAWVPFVVASLALLRPGGRLAMVVPAELLHVLHARSLRQFLVAQCAQILVLDPEDIWFEGTLQGVVLLLAEKRRSEDQRPARVAIVPVKGRGVLAKGAGAQFRRADFFPASALNGKWMRGLLSRDERALLDRLTSHPDVVAFEEVAAVDVGIVTGANEFFLVPDAVVQEHGLERWAHPMFGRSEHVRGVIYDKKRHQQNRRLGLPTNLLCFGETALSELPESVQAYIDIGRSQGLHVRYKCRIREPWYNVPSVYTAPVGMLKRSHHFPRLILNTAKAYSTDTAYRIRPTSMKPADLVLAFVNSLTALSCELEGRHYGGGVLELVPSEIERVLVPVGRHPQTALRDLDQAVRAGMQPEALLARQDALLLRPLGVTKRECEQLLAAWDRLRSRRQRRAAESPENEEAGD